MRLTTLGIWTSAAALLCGLLACGDSTEPSVPATLEPVSPLQTVATAGAAVGNFGGVRVLDASGRTVAGVSVSFSVIAGGGAVTGGVQVTDADGVAAPTNWILGTGAGENRLRVESESLTPLIFVAQGIAGPAVKLGFAQQPSEAVRGFPIAPAVAIQAEDEFGNRVLSAAVLVDVTLAENPGSTVLLGTTSVPTATGVATFSDLRIEAIAEGYTLRATAPGLAEAISDVFNVVVEPPTPEIAQIQPDVLVPGAQAIISGANFSPAAGGNTVMVDGVQASILNVSATQLTVVVPQPVLACQPVRETSVSVKVSVKTGTALHPIRSAPQLTLQVGEQRVFSTSEASRCIELTETSDAYVVSITNISPAASPFAAAFTLTGQLSSVPPPPPSPPLQLLQQNRTEPLAGRSSSLPRDPMASAIMRELRRREDSTHLGRLEENRRLLDSLGPPRLARSPAAEVGIAPPAAAPASVANVGSVNEFRYSFTSCGTGYQTLQGRTAWVGQHAIIVEDTAPFPSTGTPLNGTFDALYAQLGQEFEAVLWPTILQNFGNPLLVDAQMANHGRIIMFFTPQVNATTAQAFVYSCDFYSRSLLPKSNEAAIFYARVPTASGAGYNFSQPNGWLRVTRSTAIHETKHLASYAERVSRGWPNEASWLEEGTARHAEELYGRTIYGNSWKDNSSYADTFYCDYRPGESGCGVRPYIMPKHFQALSNYLSQSETRTVLSNEGGDFSFYGSSWALLRWAVDHYGSSEAAFFGTLVRGSSATGTANLELATGRTFAELLSEWSLAMMADDRGGFTPASPRTAFPGWNLRNVYSSLRVDFPNDFETVYPVRPHLMEFANFTETASVFSGSFSMWQILNHSGTPKGSLLLRLSSPTQGPPHPDLRMSILRLQ